MESILGTPARRRQTAALVAVLAILGIAYIPLLMTINNGSADDLMNDVGEVQVVLNAGGTLHATGYPLFVILGRLFVTGARALGMAPIVAPTVFSLLWSLGAAVLIFVLALYLTERTLLSALATVLYGLTYYTWLYSVVPNVRTMALAVEILLLLLALWRTPIPHRLFWLAALGGIAIGHHRTALFYVPAILYAVWPELWRTVRARPVIVIPLLLVGLLGFVPYVYLPLSANAGSPWTYGAPNSWTGFWDQFLGHEASQMFGLNTSGDVIRELFNQHRDLVTKQVGGAGIVVGLVGLGWGACRPTRRRAAVTLILISLVPFAFDMFGTSDHLPPFIMTFALSFVFGWLFLFDALLDSPLRTCARLAVVPLALLAAFGLTLQNRPVIDTFVHDPAGVDTIAFARRVPAGATLMFDWGLRYFAVGFAQDVLGQLGDIHRVDHKGDFADIVAHGMLVTPDYTLYEHPRRWWRERLEKRVYVRAVAPHLVQIDVAPRFLPATIAPPAVVDAAMPVAVIASELYCDPDALVVQVDWWAQAKPARDLSVFVHLVNAGGQVLAQDDQSTPVYGWRPLTTFDAGEVVRDIYSLPRTAGAARVEFGLYEKTETGGFANYATTAVPVTCTP